MRLIDILENNQEHAAQLSKTGFWGKQGAGCLPLCINTNRFLLNLRSGSVEEPHTYGTWGGAIDSGENPKEAALRELKEETGFNGEIREIREIFTFKTTGFTYYNYLIIVDEEFIPRLDWESDGFKWCTFEEMKGLRLHFGVKNILNDSKSLQIISGYLK